MDITHVFILGIIGGLTPGPITALMLGQTLRFGWKRGVFVPYALIVSNFFFAPITLLVMSLFSQINVLVTILTAIGGCFLVYLGIMEWNSQLSIDQRNCTHPFKKALALDIVNPHPYVFWFTILGPIMISMNQYGLFFDSFSVMITFTAGLVLVKFSYIVALHAIKNHLNDRLVVIIVRVLSLILVGFGLQLLYGLIFS